MRAVPSATDFPRAAVQHRSLHLLRIPVYTSQLTPPFAYSHAAYLELRMAQPFSHITTTLSIALAPASPTHQTRALFSPAVNCARCYTRAPLFSLGAFFARICSRPPIYPRAHIPAHAIINAAVILVRIKLRPPPSQSRDRQRSNSRTTKTRLGTASTAD